MADEELVLNRVQSQTTSTPGRSINRVRTHELIIDEPVHAGGPGEAITPAEAFLAGVSACGVLLVQGRARSSSLLLTQAEASIEAVRRRSDTSTFQRIDMRFRLFGVKEAQALELVEYYKQH
jgi:uncharacterized OsmC-like protein